jgi:hypothetical protein
VTGKLSGRTTQSDCAHLYEPGGGAGGTGVCPLPVSLSSLAGPIHLLLFRALAAVPSRGQAATSKPPWRSALRWVAAKPGAPAEVGSEGGQGRRERAGIGVGRAGTPGADRRQAA